GNILITLALGVGATWALRWGREGQPAAAVLLLAALAPLTYFVEFGPLGVVMVPVTAALARADAWRGLRASGPLGLLANASLHWPFLGPEGLTALLAAPLAAASARLRIRLPRLPTAAFYAFFPGHLLALHVYGLYS
ncbi:MAG: TraX family protein, partial [Chromatiales bacterium]